MNRFLKSNYIRMKYRRQLLRASEILIYKVSKLLKMQGEAAEVGVCVQGVKKSSIYHKLPIEL